MVSIDTIYALSSGGLPSGVAVIRLSGEQSRSVVKSIIGSVPPLRKAVLKDLSNPFDKIVIDRGLVLWFEGPNSFTGEDCVEFHLHGGRAVVSAFLELLSKFDNCRLAEQGEFSKRAFENGKFDLTEIEGLSDLLAAETEQQRIQAVNLSSGKLRKQLEEWRSIIVKSRALIEAELDFSDEEDVPGSVSDQVWSSISTLSKEISLFLDDNNRGEIIRDGFRVVLMGAPNSGKSSLLNAFAKRDVAIVSDEAGTTRDMIEVSLNISGFNVIITDTAGIRETQSKVELEGIRRANVAGSNANLIYWLSPMNEDLLEPELEFVSNVDCVVVNTKSDTYSDFVPANGSLVCNTILPDGIDRVIFHLTNYIGKNLISTDNSLLTRERHRLELLSCVSALDKSISMVDFDITLRAEVLRLASEHIGRITGRIDVEELLDVIFSEFCVGK